MTRQAATESAKPKGKREDAMGLGRDRVRQFTFRRDLERIDENTRDDVRRYSDLGPDSISRRLEELDREWPVDRALMTGAGCFVWLGLILGAVVNRRLYLISAIAGGILLVYAFFGWAPPAVALRRLGFRTRGEINLERTALKALRGDFDALSEGESDSRSRAGRALRASA